MSGRVGVPCLHAFQSKDTWKITYRLLSILENMHVFNGTGPGVWMSKRRFSAWHVLYNLYLGCIGIKYNEFVYIVVEVSFWINTANAMYNLRQNYITSIRSDLSDPDMPYRMIHLIRGTVYIWLPVSILRFLRISKVWQILVLDVSQDVIGCKHLRWMTGRCTEIKIAH